LRAVLKRLTDKNKMVTDEILMQNKGFIKNRDYINDSIDSKESFQPKISIKGISTLDN